jgi:hypothetical protein
MRRVLAKITFGLLILFSISLNGYLIYEYLSSESMDVPYRYRYIFVYTVTPIVIISLVVILMIQSRVYTSIWITHLVLIVCVYVFFNYALNSLLIVVENRSLMTYDSVIVKGRDNELYYVGNLKFNKTVQLNCRCRAVSFPDHGIQLELISNRINKIINAVREASPIYDDKLVLKIYNDSVSYLSFENGKSWRRMEKKEPFKTSEELDRMYNVK